MTRLLQRMIQDKEVKSTRINLNVPLFFSLPKTKAVNAHNYKHEHDCAGLYVAYENTGLLNEWGRVEEFPDYEEYKRLGLAPDRLSVIGIKIVFWEVDRGTEVLAKIEEKVEKYVKLSKLHGHFTVVFTSTKGRAKSILTEVLLPVRSRAHFFVADYEQVISHPLEAVFVSPIDPATWVTLM